MDEQLIIPVYLFEDLKLKNAIQVDPKEKEGEEEELGEGEELTEEEDEVESVASDNSVDWEEELLSEFQCQICLNYMYPPIKQCEIGHSYCEDCFGQVEVCPACESPKNGTRNFALEHIFEKLTFPCKYCDEGCTFKEKGPTVKIHEEVCDYKLKRCPLRNVTACSWTGCRFAFERHLRASHDNTCFDEEVKVKVERFKSSFRSEKFQPFFVFGEVFYLSYILTSGYFKATIFQVTKHTDLDFSYIISFCKGDTDKRIITVQGPCKVLLSSISSDYLPYFSWIVNYVSQFLNDKDELKMYARIEPC